MNSTSLLVTHCMMFISIIHKFIGASQQIFTFMHVISSIKSERNKNNISANRRIWPEFSFFSPIRPLYTYKVLLSMYFYHLCYNIVFIAWIILVYRLADSATYSVYYDFPPKLSNLIMIYWLHIYVDSFISHCRYEYVME